MRGIDGIEVARRLLATPSDIVVVLISIDELAEVVATAQLVRAVPLVRKQDVCPRLLRRLWLEHGHRANLEP
jgi:hypothetical protein